MKKSLIIVFVLLLTISFVTAQKSPLNELAIISPDNVQQMQQLERWQGMDNGFSAAAFSPNGKILALALNDGIIRLLELPSLETQTTLSPTDTDPFQLQFSRDGKRILLTHWDSSHRLWDIDSEELLYEDSSDTLSWSEANADLSVMAKIHDNIDTVTVIDMLTGETILTVDPINTLARPQLNPDGSLILVAYDDEFELIDLNTGNIIHTFESPIEGQLQGFGFTPDGAYIWANWQDWLYGRVSSENQSILQFLNTDNGSEAFTITATGTHYRMYFASTGTLFATAGENDSLQSSVWVWDMDQRHLLGEAGIPTGGGVVGFSPDGHLLAVASGTATRVQIWASTQPDNRVLSAFDIESGTTTPPQFSQDGSLLLTVGMDIRLWGIPID